MHIQQSKDGMNPFSLGNVYSTSKLLIKILMEDSSPFNLIILIQLKSDEL